MGAIYLAKFLPEMSRDATETLFCKRFVRQRVCPQYRQLPVIDSSRHGTAILPGCSGLAINSNSLYLLFHDSRKCLMGIVGNSRQGRASEKGEPKGLYSVIVSRRVDNRMLVLCSATLHQKDDQEQHRGHTLHRVSQQPASVAFSARQRNDMCRYVVTSVKSAILHMSFHSGFMVRNDFLCREQCSNALLRATAGHGRSRTRWRTR